MPASTPLLELNVSAFGLEDRIFEFEIAEFGRLTETKLLDRPPELGLDPPHVCRGGSRDGCAYTLTAGTVTMLANETLDERELQHGVRLACQSVPASTSVRGVRPATISSRHGQRLLAQAMHQQQGVRHTPPRRTSHVRDSAAPSRCAYCRDLGMAGAFGQRIHNAHLCPFPEPSATGRGRHFAVTRPASRRAIQ